MRLVNLPGTLSRSCRSMFKPGRNAKLHEDIALFEYTQQTHIHTTQTCKCDNVSGMWQRMNIQKIGSFTPRFMKMQLCTHRFANVSTHISLVRVSWKNNSRVCMWMSTFARDNILHVWARYMEKWVARGIQMRLCSCRTCHSYIYIYMYIHIYIYISGTSKYMHIYIKI